MAILQRTATLLRWTLTTVGALTLITGVWLMRDGPLFLDRLVTEQDQPAHAEAIICLCGGLSDHDLPMEEGWKRIYAALQLQLDGFAPVIIFSGGGTGRVSEAEVYAEAARWLGADPATFRLETESGSTAQHAPNLLRLDGHPVTRDSSLIIVTSELHSKRAAMCFRKAGFTNFRMVSSYVSSRRDASLVREARVSDAPGFHPNGKRYDDAINRLKWGFEKLIDTFREIVAIAYYKVRGYV